MGFYDDMAWVSELIAEAGAPVILMQAAAGDYDPTTGEVDISSTSNTGSAVRLDYKISEIDGTLIQNQDVRLLIAVTGIQQPKPGDSVQFDSTLYLVVNCKPLKPATTAVLYDVQARRG